MNTKLFKLSGAAAVSLLLSSCATTGDPTEGGFFGYSADKFHQEQAARVQYANDIDADTARKNARASSLNRQIYRKKGGY
jgi:hypothetical protein